MEKVKQWSGSDVHYGFVSWVLCTLCLILHFYICCFFL